MSVTRREFVREVGGGAVAASVFAAISGATAFAGEHRLPIAFSTLGCPAWEWGQVLDFAQQHGFSAIELRGLHGTMDLPSAPQFAAGQLAQSKREVAAHGLRIACVSSSTNLHDSDPEKRRKQLDDARRFIDLASSLGAPYVRVFGNKIEGDRAATLERVVAGLRELGAYAGPKHVTVIIESHGDFTDSPTLRQIMEGANSRHVGLLWDAHHTFAASHEEPEFTVRQLGRWIRHTHLKDSVPAEKDRKYVLTGRGGVPVERQVQALAAVHYRGFYTFEWEKAWHPDLEDPAVAFADYATVMRQYLQAAHAHAG